MPHDPQDRFRSAHIDALEERLVLSAQPAMDLFVDSFLTTQVEAATHELAPTIADVHEFTGVGAVHEQYQFTGAGQTIAVIDTGIAYDHYALGSGLGAGYRVVGGWDFAENDADPYDDGPAGFHGTHVAGIVGSSAANHRGVAPDADLVALRVFDDQGRATFDWVESALQWVHEHQHDFENPITTVNLSLGVDWNADVIPNWAMLEDEFAQLKNDGIFIAVAAGNSFADYGTSGLSYPAASPYVVPVASVDAEGQISDFSQRNDRVIAAPGEAIASTIPNHLYGDPSSSDRFLALSGTSMASPYLAGSSMLLRQAMESAGYTNINQDQLYQQFRDTADQIWDSVTQTSYHRLNLQAAIDSIFANAPETNQPQATKLGVVDDHQLHEVEINGTRYYEVIACRDGVMAITASAGQGALQLTAFDEQMNRLTESYSTAAGERLGLMVHKGQSLLIEAEGAAEDIELHFSNVMERHGDRLVLHGTAQDDAVRVELADQLWIRINGMNYGFDASAIHQLRIIGYQGNDQLDVVGSDQRDVALLRGQQLRWLAGDFFLMSQSVEQYHLDGGEGRDFLRIQDSPGDDHVVASPTETFASGNGYSASATRFQDVRAFGGAGRDTGTLNGSSGDDRFVGRANRSSLFSTDWHVHLFDFDAVQAQSSLGNDRAFLFGTSANDAFTMTTEFAHVEADGYAVSAAGFHRTVLFGEGGLDRIEHTAEIDANDFRVVGSRAVVRGTSYWYVVRDIDMTQAMGLASLDQLSGQALDVSRIGGPDWVPPAGTASLHAAPTIAAHQYGTTPLFPFSSHTTGQHETLRNERVAAVLATLGTDLAGEGSAWAYGNPSAVADVSPYLWDCLTQRDVRYLDAERSWLGQRDAAREEGDPDFEAHNAGDPWSNDRYDDIVQAVHQEMECLEFLFDELSREDGADPAEPTGNVLADPAPSKATASESLPSDLPSSENCDAGDVNE